MTAPKDALGILDRAMLGAQSSIGGLQLGIRALQPLFQQSLGWQLEHRMLQEELATQMKAIGSLQRELQAASLARDQALVSLAAAKREIARAKENAPPPAEPVLGTTGRKRKHRASTSE